jgi:hypothetical protein
MQSVGPSRVFNVSFFALIDAPIDPGYLSASVAKLAQCHESLRTTFTVIDGVPYQRISDKSALRLEIEDLRHLSAAAADAAALRHATDVMRTPISATIGPLVRALLYRISDIRCAIFVTANHLIADGWSLGVALRQVSKFYAGFASGRGPGTIELPIQYKDFAIWHNDWLASRKWEPQLDYWRNMLRGAVPNKLRPPPVDTCALPAPPGFLTFSLGVELSEELRVLSRREDVSLFTTMLAAVSIIVHDFAGETDIVIGSPIANRMLPETYELIGLFANTLALRIDLSGNPDFSTLLRRAQATCAEGFANQEVPIGIYVEEIDRGRDVIGDLIFSTKLIFQPRMPNVTLAEVELVSVDLDPGVALHDLAFHLWDEDDLRGYIEYSPEKLDPRLVPAIVENIKRIIRLAVAKPETRLSDLRDELMGI